MRDDQPVHELNAFELRQLTAHREAAGRTADFRRLRALDFAPATEPLDWLGWVMPEAQQVADCHQLGC